MLPYLHLGPLAIPTFGLMMWVAFLISYAALEKDMRRRNLPPDPATLVAILALMGLAGAKLFHLLESPHEFFAHPLRLFFSREGFAWYGGLIGGVVTLLLFARRNGVPILTMLDAASPAAALGYAVGRIGCLTSGDGDYGKPTSLPWGMSFPNGLVPTSEHVHPTPIYEFIISAIIFYFLWKLGTKVVHGERPTGEVTATFFVVSGAARFLIEIIRINPPMFMGMSSAQLASILSMIVGVGLWIAVNRRPVMARSHT